MRNNLTLCYYYYGVETVDYFLSYEIALYTTETMYIGRKNKLVATRK